MSTNKRNFDTMNNNFNEEPESIETKLHKAIFSGNNKLIKNIVKNILLLDETEQKKVINSKTIEGFTPLHITIMTQNKYAFKIISSNKHVIYDLADNNGFTPIYIATALQDIDILEFFFDGQFFMQLTIEIETKLPLFVAIDLENMDILELFIRSRYVNHILDFVDTKPNAMSPITYAITKNKFKAFEMIFKYSSGKQLQKVSRGGISPISEAIRISNVKVIKMLISKAGADIIDKTMIGYNRVIFEVLKLEPSIALKIFTCMAQHYVDFDVKDDMGDHLLIHAIKQKNNALFDLIIQQQLEEFIYDEAYEYAVSEEYTYGIEKLYSVRT
jgi:ankyrin repeat protein